MSIEIHIERLVLDGLDGLDARAVARALEAELARQLEGGAVDPQHLAPHLARLGEAVPARRIELPAAGSAALGTAVAGVVGDLLRAPPGVGAPVAKAPPAPAGAVEGRGGTAERGSP